jgi:hypothetical protein
MSKRIVFLSDEMIQQVQNQTDVSYEHAKEALRLTNGNVSDAILHVLNISIPTNTPKTKNEWDERREICTEMEHAMYQYINRCGTVQYDKDQVIRTIPKPVSNQNDLKSQAPHH